ARTADRTPARRCRLHLQSLLYPRVPQPRQGIASPRRDPAAERARGRGDRPRRPPHRHAAARSRRARRLRAAHVRRVRIAGAARSASRCRLDAPSAAGTAARRRRLPRAADDRRPRAPSPREDRGAAARTGADPHGARCRLPLSRPVRLPGGIIVRLAIALLVIVGGALLAAYLIVAPSLENRLVDAKLGGLERSALPLAHASR